MALTRPRLASLAISLALHAGLIGLATGVVYSIARPRAAIQVTLLPGGGGGAGVEASGSPAEPAVPPKPAAPEVPVQKPKQVVAKRREPAKPEVEIRSAEARTQKKGQQAQSPERDAAAESAARASGGEGTGAGPGSGSGNGGGIGAGSGEGVGAGQGSGRAVDLRLYCVSCPEPPYPRLARVRGWQGATDVELTVLGDGRVDDAIVARSSGFDVLDRAALEVARSSRFSPPPQSFSPPVRGKLAYRFELRER